jgi:hypothetical protein
MFDATEYVSSPSDPDVDVKRENEESLPLFSY